MRYLPHTPEEIAAMLTAIGAPSLDSLFDPVPADCRMTNAWDLPAAKSEWELNDHLRHLADRFVLADAAHGAIRFHADHARGKRISADTREIHPYWQRFDDLWLESHVCTPSTASI